MDGVLPAIAVRVVFIAITITRWVGSNSRWYAAGM